MKRIQVKLTRKVTYLSEITVSDEDFELIKDLDHDDVEMYDTKTVKTYDNGQRTIQYNPQYVILEDLDAEHYETEREETMYDVTVKEL